MSDRPCIVGRESCGCITYANAAPDRLNRQDEKALNRIVKAGGDIIHTTTEKARAMPHFLVSECPHDPKGWEPEPYVDPRERVRLSRHQYRDLYIVRRGPQRYSQRLGEVGRRDGGWYATPHWLDERKPAARRGQDEPGDLKGPFRTRAEAVEVIV